MSKKQTPMQRLRRIESQHTRYLRKHGGYLGVKEGDEVNNKLNCLMLNAYADAHTQSFIGTLSLYGTQRIDLVDGKISAMKEYHGEKIYNFGCDFITPIKDMTLEEMLREYNKLICPERTSIGSKIIKRIYEIGGMVFVWA